MVRSSTRVGEVSLDVCFDASFENSRKILSLFSLSECWASPTKPRHLVFGFHQALWRVPSLHALYKRVLESSSKVLFPSSSASSISASSYLLSFLLSSIPAPVAFSISNQQSLIIFLDLPYRPYGQDAVLIYHPPFGLRCHQCLRPRCH